MNSTELREQAEAWRKADPDPDTAEELARLLAGGDEAELADRFAGNLEFGTAGLRGVLGAGPNRMNRAVVRRTTAGLARYLQGPGAGRRYARRGGRPRRPADERRVRRGHRRRARRRGHPRARVRRRWRRRR